MFKSLEAAFYLFFFIFRSKWALMSRSGAMVRQRYFQSVIASLNRGLRPLMQHFFIIFFLIFYLIGPSSVVQVLSFDIDIFKV